jgi:hypothetical protein
LKKKQEHAGIINGTRNDNHRCCMSGDIFLFILQSPCAVLLAVDQTRREGKMCTGNKEQRVGGRVLASELSGQS